MRHMMMSDVVWHRMVLTAIHWGYKPSIRDQIQSENLVLFTCMVVLLNFPYPVSYSNLYGQPTYGLLRSALSYCTYCTYIPLRTLPGLV